MPRISPNAYQSVIARAWSHILKGGGIVPDDGAADLEDTISAVAQQHFDATTADTAFEQTIAGFEYAQHEAIYTAAWSLVNAYMDAAYTLGAAVALQLRGAPPSTGGAKGRRS